MDRVLPSEGRGCRFDTCRAHHSFGVTRLVRSSGEESLDTFRPLAWRFDALTSPARAAIEGIPDEIRRVRFPFRLLRYWFAHELLADELRSRPPESLRIGEIGIDTGQMLSFAQGAPAWQGARRPWSHWDGLDCSAPTDQLRGVGYDGLIQIDLDDRVSTGQRPREAYDVVILLHVVEHLFDPLPALNDVVGWLKPGGLVIGGSPGTPEIAREFWQRRLRRTAKPRGHVSVISSTLLQRWAGQLGLATELLSGAFFMRKKGFALEDHAWWLRANLAFGAAFPSWPGEMYWAWRKPAIAG
jgi:SAM-dependent methyltransferase